MNNEIKEILRKDFEDTFKKEFVDIILELPFSNLLDYITNLQEEIKRQEKAQVILDNELAELIDYKNRIDKAIERLKKIQENAIKYEAYHDASICQDLINILEGSDKNE